MRMVFSSTHASIDPYIHDKVNYWIIYLRAKANNESEA